MLEAWHAHQPLVLITASRPRSLINTGANQTADQTSSSAGTFAAYAALSDQTADPGTWRFEIARLIAAATGRGPGGPARSSSMWSSATRWCRRVRPAAAVADLIVMAAAGPRRTPPNSRRPADGDHRRRRRRRRSVARWLSSPRRPGCRCWPSRRATPGRAGRPGTARLLAASSLAEEIERVMVFGHPTLSRPISRLLAREDLELIMVSSDPDWIDPGLAVTQVSTPSA